MLTVQVGVALRAVALVATWHTRPRIRTVHRLVVCIVVDVPIHLLARPRVSQRARACLTVVLQPPAQVRAEAARVELAQNYRCYHGAEIEK